MRLLRLRRSHLCARDDYHLRQTYLFHLSLTIKMSLISLSSAASASHSSLASGSLSLDFPCTCETSTFPPFYFCGNRVLPIPSSHLNPFRCSSSTQASFSSSNGNPFLGPSASPRSEESSSRASTLRSSPNPPNCCSSPFAAVGPLTLSTDLPSSSSLSPSASSPSLRRSLRFYSSARSSMSSHTPPPPEERSSHSPSETPGEASVQHSSSAPSSQIRSVGFSEILRRISSSLRVLLPISCMVCDGIPDQSGSDTPSIPA